MEPLLPSGIAGAAAKFGLAAGAKWGAGKIDEGRFLRAFTRAAQNTLDSCLRDGLASNPEVWNRLLNYLSSEEMLRQLYDTIGTGRSSSVGHDYRSDGMSEYYLDLFRKLLIEELRDMLRPEHELLRVTLAATVSERLDGLERQLLRPPVLRSADKAATDTRPVIGELPPAPAHFVGRERDLENVLNKVTHQSAQRQASVITAVRGLPGVGKTALANFLARQAAVESAFPDGVLWASVGPAGLSATSIIAWSDAVSHPPLKAASSLKEAIALLRSALTGRKVLLIFDDVWQVESLAPLMTMLRPNASILVTTRLPVVAQGLDPTGAGTYYLDVLSESDAVSLLRLLAPEFAEHSPESCRLLAKSLGYLPLALQVAGRLLAAESSYALEVNSLAADFSEDPRRLLSEHAPVDQFDPVTFALPTFEAVLQRSTELLPAEARTLFARLGAFAPKPATISLRDIADVSTKSSWVAALRTLLQRGLVEPALDQKQFCIHPVLAAHARALGDI